MSPNRRNHATMSYFSSVAWFVALVGARCAPAYALGGDYGPQDLQMLVGTIGGQVPIHGYWVNSEDVFFYSGRAEEFNQFIAAYSSFKHRRLEVVVHRGSRNAASPWRQIDLRADWSLYIWNNGASFLPKIRTGENGEEEVEFEPVGEPAPTRVDVWVNDRLKLPDLRIPAALEVTAAVEAGQDDEIQKFIVGCQAPVATGQADVTADREGGPFRLTVELYDGSRLLGETSDVKHLALQARFGQVSIPLEQVASIEFPIDQSNAVICFRNGDRLTGVLNPAGWEALKLRTVVGDVTVPIRLMRSCAIARAPRMAKVSVRASGSWQTETPDRAFDGNRDTDWNSGTYAPAWLEADLGAPTQLATIQLFPCQDIVGATTHEIWVSDEPIGDDRAKAKLIHTFHGETNNHQPLKFEFPKDLSARYVQIHTTQSPTWIAWWEVEIRIEHAD